MDALSATVLVALGATLGSFGNVLVARLPSGASLGGRSACDGCGATLRAADLVPVFSAVCAQAKARCCGKRYAWTYTLWEALTALLFLAAWAATPAFPEALVLGLCFWLLTAIGRIDAQTQLIPDVLNVALIVCAGLLSVLYGEVPLMAATVCLAVFGGQWVLSRGRWIGSGDVLLAVGIALMLRHPEAAVLMTLVAYVLGACVAVVLLLQKRTTMENAIAFGPFLCIAAIAVSLLGERVLAWAL